MKMILIFHSILFFFSLFKVKKDILFFFPLLLTSTYIYTVIGVEYNFALEIPFKEQLTREGDLINVGWAYFLASLFFYIGSKCNKYGGGKVVLNNVYLNFNQKFIVTFIFFSGLAYYLAIDWNYFLYRDTYTIPKISNSLYLAFKLTSPIAAFLLPFINNRALRYSLFIFLWLLPFSANSRTMGLIVFMYLLGLTLTRRNNAIKMFLLSLFVVFCMAIALGFRFGESQGLIPNILNIIDRGVIFSGVVDSINYVSSFSVHANSYAIKYHYSDFYSYLISINPLPSGFLDIKHLTLNSKLNQFAPVPGIAMVYNQGMLVLFFTYFILGFIFSFMKKYYFLHNLYYLFIALFIAFCFFNTQYILRESMRFFYYLVLIYSVLTVFNKLPKRVISPKNDGYQT